MTNAIHVTSNLRTSLASRQDELYIESTPRHYRIYTGKEKKGAPLMQSKAAYLVWASTSNSPILAFSKDEIKWWNGKEGEAGLVESKSKKGSSKLASIYYDLVLSNGTHIESAAWTYDDSTPISNKQTAQTTTLPSPSKLIALQTSKFPSAWEEDAPILDHVKNPYHRVDAVPSSRHIQVYALAKSGKEVLLVDTAQSKGGTMALFETGLPTRWYLPLDAFQVNQAGKASMHPPPACSLQQYPSDGLQTTCPYKGVARYHSITLPDDEVLKNVAWSYPEQIPELDLRGLVALWTPGNDALKLVVDGEQV